MNNANFSSESPLLLGCRGYLSERTEHQSPEKVKEQTSHKEVHLFSCMKVFLPNFCYLLLNVHICSCSKGVNMKGRIGEKHKGRRTGKNDKKLY